MAGDNYKAKVMRRQLPPPYKKEASSFAGRVLTIIGQSDNLIGGLFGPADFLPDDAGVVAGSTDAQLSMIQQVRQSMLVSGAAGAQLDAVGNNRNVPRPENTTDDELYRGVIKALAWLPKSVLLSYYALLSAVFGSQEAARARVGRAWKVYEVNPNEVIIELPSALIAGTLETSSYLHGASGYARVTSGPSGTFTTDVDLRTAIAVSPVGFAVYVETLSGTWGTFSISAYSFSAGVATVTVTPATLPTGGGRFVLDVPGDGTVSYRGDYVATGGVTTTYSTAAGPATNTLLVAGDITEEVLASTVVTISVGGVFQTRVPSALTYSSATNVTTVTLTTTDVPGGQVGQAFVVGIEQADTPTTPPHNDRIYLTGTGLYQVVQFYLDLLVRASGIVVRLQVI